MLHLCEVTLCNITFLSINNQKMDTCLVQNKTKVNSFHFSGLPEGIFCIINGSKFNYQTSLLADLQGIDQHQIGTRHSIIGGWLTLSSQLFFLMYVKPQGNNAVFKTYAVSGDAGCHHVCLDPQLSIPHRVMESSVATHRVLVWEKHSCAYDHKQYLQHLCCNTPPNNHSKICKTMKRPKKTLLQTSWYCLLSVYQLREKWCFANLVLEIYTWLGVMAARWWWWRNSNRCGLAMSDILVTMVI